MRWWFSFGWLCAAREKRRRNRPTRRWIKIVRPWLEPLEERRMLANNVWLPQQLTPFDGTTQTNYTVNTLFEPATANVLPQLGLKGTSLSATGSIGLSDTGNYSLSLTQAGAYDGNGDKYTFSESGTVSFALSESGTLAVSGFSVNSYSLTQTATLSWSFVETNSSGQTVQNLSGSNTLNGIGNGTATLDPFFAQGFNWLSLTQKLSSLNTLGLASLSASALTVTETKGSDSYTFQETNGVATVTGNAQQSLTGDLMQNGQTSYSDTASDDFKSTNQGSDSFSLTELGCYASGSYALSSVSYQENGTSSYSSTPTVTNTESGNGSSSGAQSFSGDNHSLGDSSSESFQFNDLSTLSYGETATSNYTLSLQGSFGGGSFNLSSLSYSANGSGNYSLTQTALETQTGTFSDSNNASGTDSYGVAGSLGDSGTSTDGGNYTSTSNTTATESESGNFTLTQQGGYQNGSWALSSYSLTESMSGTFAQQQLDTTTQSGSGTATESGSATDTYALGYGSSNTTSATQTSNAVNTTTETFTTNSPDSNSQSGPCSYSFTLQGALQNGVTSLSCYVYSSTQSGTWSDSSTSNQTTNGASQQSVSGNDGANDCFSDSGVSNNALSGDTYASTNSLSFAANQSNTSSDSGSLSDSSYRVGVYNSGSFSLSATDDTFAQSYSWSYSNTNTQTDNGNDTTNATSTAQNDASAAYAGGTFGGLGNQTSTQTSTDYFTDSSVVTVSESGSAYVTFIFDGTYGGDAFAYGSVLLQENVSYNGTYQDAYTGTYGGTVSDSMTVSGNQSANGTFNITAASGNATFVQTTQDTYTVAETVTSGDTYALGDTATLYEQGSFNPESGGWSLNSVNYQETYTSSFTSTQSDNASDSGTDSYSSTSTAASNATTSFGGVSATAIGTLLSVSTGTDSFSDSYGQTATQAGGSSWSISEQGSFSGESFNLGAVVYQGGQTFSQTYTYAETHSSQGTANDGSTSQSSGFNGGVYAASANSGVNSVTQNATDSYSTGGSSVYSQTQTGTDCSTFYESGQYSGGSYSLGSVNSAETFVSQYTYSGGDTQTQSGQQTTLISSGGNGTVLIDDNSFAVGISEGNTWTASSAQTATDAYSGSGGDCWSSSQQGSYSNFSFGYANVVYQSHDSVAEASMQTATSSSTQVQLDTLNATDTLSGTIYDGSDKYSGSATWLKGSSDCLTQTAQSTAIQSYSSTDSSNFYQSGSYSLGSYSLNSVSYAESYSDSYGDTATDSATQVGPQSSTANLTILSGSNLTASGATFNSGSGLTITSNQTTSGTATVTSSDTLTNLGGDSYSLTEQGTYGNYSYSLSSLVYQGSDTVVGTSMQQSGNSYQGTYTGNASSLQSNSGSSAPGQDSTGSSSLNTLSGTITVYESNYSSDSLTDNGGQTSTFYQAGSYAGGSYGYSLSQTWSASDSYTQFATASTTTTTTLTGTLASSSTLTTGMGGGLLSNSYSSQQTASSNAFLSYSVQASQSSQTTLTGSDGYTQFSQGTCANYSTSLSVWNYSAADTATQCSTQTDILTQTLTANGSNASCSATTLTSALAVGGGMHSHSMQTATWASTSNQSNTFNGTITSAATAIYTQLGTYNDSLYESGIYGNGSYSLSSMSDTVLSTLSSTQADSSSQTTTDSLSASQTQTATYQGPPNNEQGSQENWLGSSEQDTLTNTNNSTISNNQTYSLYEGGGFGGGSWGLSSYNLYQSTLTTTLLSGTGNTSSMQTGSYGGSFVFDGAVVYSLSGTYNSPYNYSGSSQYTQVQGYWLSEVGHQSTNGSFSLTSFSCTQNGSSSGCWTGTGTSTESFSGTNTANGTASYSGSETATSSSSGSDNSNATVTQQGSYSNGTFALSLSSYSGSNNASGSSTNTTTSGWSGSYSGAETIAASVSSTDSYSLTGSGSFSNGSFSLSCYVLTGGGSGGSSSSDVQEQTDNGASSSYSNTQQNQEVASLYQTGSQSGGVYSNGSYQYLDDSTTTVTDAAQGPGYGSSDSWVQQSSTSLYGSGSSSEISSASYTYQSGGGSGTLTNNSSATPANSTAGAAVQFAAPDGTVVPTATLSSAAGPGSGSGGTATTAGGTAPVPINASSQQVSDGQAWLSNTQQVGSQLTGPTLYSNASNGVTAASASSTPSASGNTSASGSALVAAAASGGSNGGSGSSSQGGMAGLSSSVSSGKLSNRLPGVFPPTGSFSVEVWSSVQPLFTVLVPWLGGPSAQIQSSLQQFLGIPQPTSQSAAAATPGPGGDPFVAWVDNMLENNGQPLTAGSAPLYGPDGNSTAGQALAVGLSTSIQMLSTSAGPVLGLLTNSALTLISASAGDASGVMTYGGRALGNAAEIVQIVGTAFNPCGLIAKGSATYGLASNIVDMSENGVNTKNAIGALMNLTAFLGGCFTGDMLLLSKEDKKRADAIREGDLLWSRDEHDPEGPLVLKRVLRRFEWTGEIWHVRLPGQVLRTTVGHPFWVENHQRWLSAGDLREGDLVRTDSGELLAVEGVDDSGEVEKVYNWEIEDYHTYFVSASEDAASIWAHNTGDRNCTGASEEGEVSNIKLSPRATRRLAMREAGIPTSQQPVSQRSVRTPQGKPIGRQYTYETPTPGGGKPQIQSVQHSLTDQVEGHGPYWEAGPVKLGGQLDSLGRPRLQGLKIKVYE